MVYGGEISHTFGDVETDPLFARFTGFTDLKLRAGYASGRALFYGTAGWSFTEWSEDGFEPLNTDGPLIGVGVDMMVSDKFFIGADYLYRDLESDTYEPSFPTIYTESTVSTFTIRGGFRF